jgi:hypothetical protein
VRYDDYGSKVKRLGCGEQENWKIGAREQGTGHRESFILAMRNQEQDGSLSEPVHEAYGIKT